MAGNYLTDPMTFLITSIGGLYVFALMLRLMLQWAGAEFYNPVSQTLVRITNPVVVPLRRLLPSLRSLDTGTLAAALAVQFLVLQLASLISSGSGWPVLGLLVLSVWELINTGMNIILFSVLIHVVLSWVNPHADHPVLRLVDSLCAASLEPIRRVLPGAGGLDFSPMVLLFGLFFLKMLLQPIFMDLARSLS